MQQQHETRNIECVLHLAITKVITRKWSIKESKVLFIRQINVFFGKLICSSGVCRGKGAAFIYGTKNYIYLQEYSQKHFSINGNYKYNNGI